MFIVRDFKKWRGKSYYDLITLSNKYYNSKLNLFKNGIKLKEYDCEYYSKRYKVLKRCEITCTKLVKEDNVFFGNENSFCYAWNFQIFSVYSEFLEF